MAALSDLSLMSLRGGLDDTTPIAELAKDMCTRAENVEFFWSTVGERRFGCDAFDLTDSGLEDFDEIVHLSQWFPRNVVNTPEIWTVGANPDVNAEFRFRTTGGIWQPEPLVVDEINPDTPQIYEITTTPGPSSLSPNGKLFIQYPNEDAVDRSHVWDPNNVDEVRRTGLPEPDPPTVGNGIVFAVPPTKRWYRIRLVRQAGTNGERTLLSEPSTSVVFTPDGVHAPRITHPVFPSDEAQTHWEVEGSFDDITYYTLQSLLTATAFWDDTFTDPISFSEEGVLSDAIGSYLLIPNVKYAAVDGDRLVMGGHWDNPNLGSTVWWTPVFTDPGIGNDERVPIVTTGGLPIVSTFSLDNYSGGAITGMSTAISGSWYVFKWNHIYKLMRTNNFALAYQSMTMSTTRGAIPGSIFDGADENGSPAIFFLDPYHGPSVISGQGLRTITGLRRTWNRINIDAANIVARGLYYPYKRQAHWWLASENADTPNYKFVLQITELRDAGNGEASRGWSVATGRITEALCVALITDVVTVNGATTVRSRPFVGMTNPDLIQRCDYELTTEDAGVPYVATIVSAPIALTGLLTQWGAMRTALMGSANPTTTVDVSLIRDFGLETSDPITVPLDAETTEPYVMRQQDGLVMSESKTVQIQFTDTP